VIYVAPFLGAGWVFLLFAGERIAIRRAARKESGQ
jgi:hypothetical protein